MACRISIWIGEEVFNPMGAVIDSLASQSLEQLGLVDRDGRHFGEVAGVASVLRLLVFFF